MAPGRFTGGRKTGVSKNKPKPIKLPDTPENRALVLMAPMLTQGLRSPKAVMLDAMARFDTVAIRLWNQAEELVRTGAETGDVKTILEDSFKYSVAAVQCAEKAAPYTHAKLLSIESRTEEKAAPFVVRAPAVMADSSAWQAAVGAAVVDMEAAQSPGNGVSVRQTEAEVTLPHPAQTNAPVTAVALMNDPKTNRITVMPPGPRVVQPSGTEAWLASIQKKVG